MKLLIVGMTVLCLAGLTQSQSILDVATSDGMINEVIGADTLADGTQAHDVYRLVTLNATYKFTDAINARDDISIVGVLDGTTGRPPCIQPAILQDQSIPLTFIIVNAMQVEATLQNLYLLAYAPNNNANAAGVAISVTADDVRLTVDNCVFDGWQGFGIGYSGNWDDFFVSNSHFRNFIHPNQWYVGEVIRNTWPGEAYTDTMSFTGNTMLCVNGYAACPVTKYYETYFEFNNNKVLYTFKNPFFIFNVTDAKINNNIFYGLYAGGVDTLENPWWDNLWNPDTTYGVIALQPLSGANAKMFQPSDSANAEGLRRVEVSNNTYFWPTALTDFWTNWNNTQPNKVRTPNFMNVPTTAMFANDANYPYLVESGNVNVDPGFMGTIDPWVLNGSQTDFTIGLLAYFQQVRTGTAANDYWGYELTFAEDTPNWVPVWPLPEASSLSSIDQNVNPEIPADFSLEQNFPNPFNPTTTIKFNLKTAGNITLVVYNVMGQVVETLIDGYKPAGTYTQVYHAKNLASGIYYYELKAGSYKAVHKMLLIK
jgi:hypothetical protein